MSLKRWIWLATLLALMMGAPGARAQTADLRIEQVSLTPASYTPGQSVIVIMRVVNPAGGSNATGVRVQGVVDTEFALYSYSFVETTGVVLITSGATGSGADANNDNINDSPGTVDFTLNINANSTASLRFTAVPRLNSTATIVQPFEIVDTGNITDPNLDNNLDGFGIDLNTGAPRPTELGITLCTDPGSPTPLTVVTSDTVLNTYFTPSATDSTTLIDGLALGAWNSSNATGLDQGSTCLPTAGVAGIGASPTDLSSLQAGDKLLVVQMQNGIGMDSSNGSTYGAWPVTTPARNRVGLYEFVEVRGAIGTGECADGIGYDNPNGIPVRGGGVNSSGNPTLGLINRYTHRPLAAYFSLQHRPKATVQYIRVPRHSTITFANGASAAPLPWDGTRGGVLAIEAVNEIDLGNNIGSPVLNASCKGFRGGGRNNVDVVGADGGALTYRIKSTSGNGIKGEGFGGTPRLAFDGLNQVVSASGYDGYPGGTTGGSAAGKGSPLGAGGGGNACATTLPLGTELQETAGGSGGGNGGQGGDGGTCLQDWTLGTGEGFTGGILGPIFSGYTFAGADCSATTVSPNCVGRLTMGPGGGSGASNGSSGNQTSGGVGGGVIIALAAGFTGKGDIVANGCNGEVGGEFGGGGGGGAGGSISLVHSLASITTWADISVRANGGIGGNAGVGTGLNTRRGPGGGGGAGRIYVSATALGAVPALASSGGANGTTDGGTTNFGATTGNNFSPPTNVDAYNAQPGLKSTFICSGGTVPVTLSFIDAKVQGSELVVNFETASEAGTLGYRVYTDVPGASRMQLNAELVPGKGDSLAPQRYTVRGAFRGAREVWIEEVDVKGKSTVYGPFPIGSPSGEQNIAVSTDWQAIQAEQDAFRTAEAQAIVARRSSTGAVVELRTSKRGWYSVSFEQLAGLGVDWNGVESRRLELRRGTRSIPVEVSGPTWQAGATLRFYGEQVEGSLYTDTAVYQLRLAAGDAEPMRPVYANAGNLQSVNTYLHTLVHAPNRAYGFSSPTDPWYAARILRNANNPGTASETVTVADRVAGSTARLTVDFWGGTDYPQTPDHAVRVLINGTPVGEARFDGFATHTLTADLPANVLVNGNNTVSFQLLADTGAPADVVYLERIAIDYVRELKLEANGSVAFGAAQGAPGATDGDRIFAGDFSAEGTPACSAMTPGCAAYAVQVGSSANARAFRIRDGIAQPLTAAVNGGVLRFAALSRPGDQFRVDAAAAAPALRVAEPVGDLFGGLSAVDYLVVSHPSFSAGLQPLLAARQAEGLRTHVVNVEDLYRAYTGGEFGPAAVEAFLRESHQRWPMLRYVLFVGGDTYDYKNHSGLNSIGFVPTHYRETSPFVRYAPTDTVYADVNGDGVKELAIGRFPVRTAAELANVVAKTLAYPMAGHANQLVWVTDRESNSYNYRSISGNFTAGFTDWTKQFVDLNTYPTSGGAASARGDLVAALNGGKALLGYYGHSSPSSWTREGLLTATLVNGGLFNNATRPTALFQLGCWGGYFVDPQYSSLSHAFLLRPSGAAAVIAATALTEVSSDELFSSVALPALRQGRRIGDVVRDSANAIRLSPAGQGALDVVIGTTVLGDPAMKINVQQPR